MGKQDFECTPWGNPLYNVFGWQRPCYLLVGEGYANSYRELMEDTDWDAYGVGRNPKCANCMVHCGYEPTAVSDTVVHPLKALKVWMRGVETEAPMLADVDLSKQRAAEYMFEKQVANFLTEDELEEAETRARKAG